MEEKFKKIIDLKKLGKELSDDDLSAITGGGGYQEVKDLICPQCHKKTMSSTMAWDDTVTLYLDHCSNCYYQKYDRVEK